MAFPTPPAVLHRPVGTPFQDGFAVAITLMNATTAPMWEKEVTPPTLSVHGGGYDTTSIERGSQASQAPKWLRKTGELRAVVAYSADAYLRIAPLVGVLQPIMVTFLPSYDRINFYGWLDEFSPNPHKAGEMPSASVTIQVANQDAFGYEHRPTFSYGPTVAGKADFSRYDGSGLSPLFT